MTGPTATLREYVRAHAENRPGIYRMTGPGDELLYVGKSVKVRSRLLSYFTAERGEISLGFLADLPVEEARAWLLSIPGVGPKTAAIVLLFALGMPAFPVDTHVHRLSRRLGLIPEKTSREKAHDLLEALVPPELYYVFHLNLIAHGRAVCHARNPEHERCVLREVCVTYREQT